LIFFPPSYPLLAVGTVSAARTVWESITAAELLDCGIAHVGSASPNPPHFVPAAPLEMALQGILRKDTSRRTTTITAASTSLVIM
jgi:hypothetical protein